jgi:hypothetical protein
MSETAKQTATPYFTLRGPGGESSKQLDLGPPFWVVYKFLARKVRVAAQICGIPQLQGTPALQFTGLLGRAI